MPKLGCANARGERFQPFSETPSNRERNPSSAPKAGLIAATAAPPIRSTSRRLKESSLRIPFTIRPSAPGSVTMKSVHLRIFYFLVLLASAGTVAAQTPDNVQVTPDIVYATYGTREL